MALCETTSDELDPGWRGRHDLLGGGLDWDAIQGDWFGEEHRQRRGREEATDDRHGSSANGTVTEEGGREAIVVAAPTRINLHADMAAVNVNICLNTDGTDLMEEGYGGPDWTFESYKARTDQAVEELLRPANFANVAVHHRPNHAVIFDLALFHHTERYRFKRGYENGRINLTLLFCEMRRVGDNGSCSLGMMSTADQ